ncbi:beta-ketoacyl synthase N-terminal-like domain-containing protein [Dactylosporangium matsuzakiense]|uniref:Polyketide biosynthesis malonyl-ACP decarboxylase PksF n=1 Tax=Dactylosporangium matsuzakiense TaxID=53360 RepID=A0A9W6KPU5_9ACTN|nr:beta-ketoacyl synthase N-terminal-like domain-containing protein [Dactylosporangium matsuzakiense]GLL05333.1 polyketide biosynthesis malonyl-ACP decarboxylase PksF [Dactylosporangium matsuzakiense]
MTAPCEVVVTGTGVLCSTAAGTEAFAAALRDGVSGIGLRPVLHEAEQEGLRPTLSADLRGFDFRAAVAARAGLPERLRASAVRVAGRAPLAIRAAVAVALEAWESAGLHRVPVPADRIGIVVAGHNLGGRYAEEVRPRYSNSPVHLPARYPLRFMDTDHVGTVSQVLGITGEGYTVGGASASGNVAIINGSRLVAAGAVDVCLVLGALTDLSAMELQGFYNLGAMAGVNGDGAPHERCRPFDADREGFVPGQGAACLVLESAESAARRRAPAWARVAGHALRLDGNGLADPSIDGESWVMTRAIHRAGIGPDRIGYVNAHGTGSTKGDEVELTALREVFPPEIAGPWVNSTKGLIGHCLCAAGVVEAVASLVQMREGFVHPNANLRAPIDPARRLVGALAQPAEIGYAMSNGFGFGGFNTSVVFGRPDRG